MQYQDILPYLQGKRFSNSLAWHLPRYPRNLVYRMDLLKSMVKDKRIIHLGCADHPELIQKKIDANRWLHQILTDSAQECLGIDINQQGIDFMINSLKLNNVICDNIIESDIPRIAEGSWDYIILGELIEHLDNLNHFLINLKQKYGHNIKRMIITVPNAFYIRNVLGAFLGKETINSDHRIWLTPYTLCKNLVQAGLTVESIYLVQGHPISGKYFAARAFLSYFHMLRSTIVAIVKLG